MKKERKPDDRNDEDLITEHLETENDNETGEMGTLLSREGLAVRSNDAEFIVPPVKEVMYFRSFSIGRRTTPDLPQPDIIIDARVREVSSGKKIEFIQLKNEGWILRNSGTNRLTLEQGNEVLQSDKNNVVDFAVKSGDSFRLASKLNGYFRINCVVVEEQKMIVQVTHVGFFQNS